MKKQLQIEENSSGKSLKDNRDTAKTPWNTNIYDWRIEKHRKHLTCAGPSHLPVWSHSVTRVPQRAFTAHTKEQEDANHLPHHRGHLQPLLLRRIPTEELPWVPIASVSSPGLELGQTEGDLLLCTLIVQYALFCTLRLHSGV